MARKPISNNRCFERVRVAVPVRFCVAGRAALPIYDDGETIDLSCGGLLLRCDDVSEAFLEELIEEDHALRVRMLVRSGKWAKARARVVWMERDEATDTVLLRACFVGLPAESTRLIDELLASPHA